MLKFKHLVGLNIPPVAYQQRLLKNIKSLTHFARKIESVKDIPENDFYNHLYGNLLTIDSYTVTQRKLNMNSVSGAYSSSSYGNARFAIMDMEDGNLTSIMIQDNKLYIQGPSIYDGI